MSPSCYELLGVPVDAPRRELGRAWSARREEAASRVGKLDEADVDALMGRIDEAFQILSDRSAAQRYRMYRGQLAGGQRLREVSDLARLVPDEISTDPGVPVPTAELSAAADDEDDLDAVTTLDEWDVDGEFDEEDEIESSKTEAMAPAFSAGIGLLSQVVLAVPSPRDRTEAPGPYSRRDGIPPWALDPPEPEAMRPPVYKTVPGASLPGAPRRAPVRPSLGRPPWED